MKYTRHYIWSTLLLAASMTLLTGCTADETISSNSVGSHTPITFDAKVNTASVRGSGTGSINYSVLTKYGFGVYAYGGVNWNNKKVWYDGKTPADELGDVHEHTGNWRYWEEGENPMIWGDQTISFLAYAPYVESVSDDTGITAITEDGVENTRLTYTIADNPVDGVDLLWGVRDETHQPWLNTTVADANVCFSFHHALTAIGFHVQAMIDKDNDLGDYEDESNVDGILDKNYKITLKDITLTGDFYSKADLYLNNTESGVPNWKEHSGKVETLTVGNDNINSTFRHPNVSEAKTAKDIITDQTIKGITQDAEQLVIAKKEGTEVEQCFFVIPNSDIPNSEKLKYKLTVNWCISYKKGKEYIVEEHKAEIPIDDWKLRPEVKYYLNLVFGLKSVRLTVIATDWANNPIDITDIFEHGTSANESL